MNLSIEKLRDLAEEERQRCLMFGCNPDKSMRYRNLMREITIFNEDFDPNIRAIKKLAVAILMVMIPTVVYIIAATIHGAIKLLIA